MKEIFFWFLISSCFSKYGMCFLRAATIPVSGRVMNYSIFLVDVIPGCTLFYAFFSWLLFEIYPREDPIQEDFLKWVENYGLKFASALAICATIIQYYGFSLSDLNFSLVYGVGLLVYSVKPDLFVFRSILVWCLPFIISPLNFKFSITVLVPFFHLLKVEPYFKHVIATSSLAAHVYQQRRYIEIVCGMSANLLTAYYFRFQSADLLIAFLYLAIASLGIYANLRPSTDFGIIQFLVTSSVQYSVTLFGLLDMYTCLVFLAGCVIMVLRWKMASSSLSHFAEQESCWGGKFLRYLLNGEPLAFLCPLVGLLPGLLLKRVPMGDFLIFWGGSSIVLKWVMKFLGLYLFPVLGSGCICSTNCTNSRRSNMGYPTPRVPHA